MAFLKAVLCPVFRYAPVKNRIIEKLIMMIGD
jgi:hypothetical protein